MTHEENSLGEMVPVDESLDEAIKAEVEATDAGELADTPQKQLLYRVLRRRAQVESELSRVKGYAGALIRQLAAKLEAIDLVYEPLLTEVVSGMLTGKSRSVKTPFGVAGFRKKPSRLDLVDEDAVKHAVFEGVLPDHIVKAEEPKIKVVMSELNDLYETTGEIPPGCIVLPESDTFYLKG